LPAEGISAMPVPLSYKQIADDVAHRIASGLVPAGSRLPSYDKLAAEYGVSYATAARAYGLLVDRGVVVGSPGRGMFAPDPAPEAPAAGPG
jgi:DNA-binding GntR family transcriptional regulator